MHPRIHSGGSAAVYLGGWFADDEGEKFRHAVNTSQLQLDYTLNIARRSAAGDAAARIFFAMLEL